VTLVYRGENILRGFDDDLRAHLHAEMTKRGVRILCGRTVRVVQRTQDTFTARLSDDSSVEVDKVMFALGRWPNVGDLGLDAAGVRFTPNRGIAVDPLSQTSVPHIHAIGDVTNRVNLTPVAIREGHAFADTVFGGRPTAVDHTNVPTAVFSEPEVGTVGLTEAQACERLAKVDVYKMSFRPLKMTLAGRDTRAFFKLVVDGESDQLVGCHIVGPDASEMIQLVAVALKMKATKADIDAVIAVHPTAAEELVTLREKALSHRREAAE
jgi:glutathione reductase (NADPH)